MVNPPDETPATTSDQFMAGRMVLEQPLRGHRIGTDALLLAATSRPLAVGNVADFGAGVGGAGIATVVLAASQSLTLVELDPVLASIAARNLTLNRVQHGRALSLDILAVPAKRHAAGLTANSMDHVMMNPPFRDEAAMRASPDPQRRLAHTMPDEALDLWVRAAAHHLVANGTFALIHRADAVGLVLAACHGRFGAIGLRFVHPKADAPAIRLLLTGLKGSRAPMRILPALVLHEADGRFTALSEAIHKGDAALD